MCFDVGRRPAAIVIAAGGRTAYVSNAFPDTVTPINIATNTAAPSIATGNAPEAMTFALPPLSPEFRPPRRPGPSQPAMPARSVSSLVSGGGGGI